MTRRKKNSTTAATVIIALIVLAAYGLLIERISGGETSSTVFATDTPASTPTPDPRRVEGTKLGGPLAAFESAYTQDGFAYDGTVAGHLVSINLAARGSDGVVQRVTEITVYPGSINAGWSYWDAATATAIAKAFLPPDAVHLRDTLDEFGYGYTEHVYRCVKLAASLEPTVFVDEVDLTTENQPGTFMWSCVPFPSNAPGFGKCTISTAAPKS
jgi:hypothetical protein